MTEQGYSVAQAADEWGVTQNLLYTWKQKDYELYVSLANSYENTEPLALKKEVKSQFIRKHRSLFPTKMGFVA
ncbi:transposase [Vibrio toranzoniae]|nr:transposase [Vibrio toranzoniae]